MAWRIVLSAIGLMLVVGCSAVVNCTAVGCQSGVTIDVSALALPAGATATVCISRVCTTAAAPSDGKVTGVQPSNYATSGHPVEVSVLVTARDHRVLAKAARKLPLPRIFPNGVKCQPACYDATLVLGADGTLTSA